MLNIPLSETIALRELPWIPLMHYRSKALIAPRLHGYVPNLRNAAPTRFMTEKLGDRKMETANSSSENIPFFCLQFFCL